MTQNLKKQYAKRAVLFEDLARMRLRNKEKNNFIFCTRKFTNLEELSKKYQLNLENLDNKILVFLDKNFHSVDLIQFNFDETEYRKVNNLVIYEVKTRNKPNGKMDLCFSSFNTYDWLQRLNVETKLVLMVLLENWNYKFNVLNMNLDNFRRYTRFVDKNLNKT